jgi:hypothetical protein
MDLNVYAKSVYSQAGEDGILEKLFSTLKIEKGWCCEFGAGDGFSISNTYKLRKEGWSSVLIEGNTKYELSLNTLKNNNTYSFINFISCENGERLDEILSKTPIPVNFDLLSIDIDGNDLYIWKSLKNYRPKVVIIEYNNCYPSSSSLTIEYDKNHRFDNDSYYGASAGALVKLAHELGYKLVGFTLGLNLVFCINELCDKFKEHDHRLIPQMNGHKHSNRSMVTY